MERISVVLLATLLCSSFALDALGDICSGQSGLDLCDCLELKLGAAFDFKECQQDVLNTSEPGPVGSSEECQRYCQDFSVLPLECRCESGVLRLCQTRISGYNSGEFFHSGVKILADRIVSFVETVAMVAEVVPRFRIEVKGWTDGDPNPGIHEDQVWVGSSEILRFCEEKVAVGFPLDEVELGRMRGCVVWYEVRTALRTRASVLQRLESPEQLKVLFPEDIPDGGSCTCDDRGVDVFVFIEGVCK